MDGRDEYDEVIEIVKDQTEYIKMYTGLVIDRRFVTNGLGQFLQIKALVFELGFLTPDVGMWCSPRNGRAQIIPELDEYVQVGFTAGDPDRPYFLYPMSEVSGSGIDNDDFEKDIVYQDQKKTVTISFNKKTDKLEIGKTALLEAARKGDKIQAIIPAGTVVVDVTGGSGAPAVGVKNAMDIILEGEIIEGSDQIFVGKK